MVGFIYIKIPASERLVFLIPIANRIRGRLVTIPVVGRSAYCIEEIVEFFKFKNRYKNARGLIRRVSIKILSTPEALTCFLRAP